MCYYTGYSDPFNGSNFEDKNVYGSEIAAIKLCEQLASQYSVFIFCACKNEIFYNGVQYYNLKKYDEFQNLYPVDILIVSRLLYISTLYLFNEDSKCFFKISNFDIFINDCFLEIF